MIQLQDAINQNLNQAGEELGIQFHISLQKSSTKRKNATQQNSFDVLMLDTSHPFWIDNDYVFSGTDKPRSFANFSPSTMENPTGRAFSAFIARTSPEEAQHILIHEMSHFLLLNMDAYEEPQDWLQPLSRLDRSLRSILSSASSILVSSGTHILGSPNSQAKIHKEIEDNIEQMDRTFITPEAPYGEITKQFNTYSKNNRIHPLEIAAFMLRSDLITKELELYLENFFQ
jgi:hypothetical protein